jgi:hypothetical protein
VPTPEQTSEVISALEAFVFENADLERLEALLDRFNPFVAMRWTRREVRHSAFLRWFLDPRETHGLGAYWLRAFLKRLARRARGSAYTPSVIDLDSWDLSGAVVQSEWRSIDVLILDDVNRFVAVIENKTDTTEHSDQLQRYRVDVEQHFPEHQKLFAFLTPGQDIASDSAYVTAGYSDIVELIQDTLHRRRDQLASEVAAFIEQYAEMVRGEIVEDSEIQQLCRSIYDKHRKALDILFEYRPDRATEVMGVLVEAIEARPELTPDYSGKSYVRFIPGVLDAIPKVGDGWTRSKRLLLFELDNSSGQAVTLKLTLGPGDENVRTALHRAIQARPGVFNRAAQTLSPKFWACHTEKWISPAQYEDLDATELRTEVDARLDRLITDQLPKVQEALRDVLRSDFGASV